MIVALAVFILLLTSAFVIGHQLEKAPEGFENETGFHFVNGGAIAASGINVRSASSGVIARGDKAAAASLS